MCSKFVSIKAVLGFFHPKTAFIQTNLHCSKTKIEQMSHYILALDQGTTSSRAIVFDQKGNILASSQREFTQIYPQPGWVEHNPIEIWETQLRTAREALSKGGITAADLAGVGITNQRETTVLWNRQTGEPLGNAIVWQDRRTAAICAQIKAQGLEPYVRQHTGLVVDAYFSASKIRWILDHFPNAQAIAQNGDLCFGTIDTWLIWKLTGGKVHATDHSNASRTMLYNIGTLQWDEVLLNAFKVPKSMLPDVRPSSGNFGHTLPELLGASVAIGGVAGDQQAALFGQTCFEKGMAKNTYGTGCFMLLNTGDQPVASQNGLISTIAWGLGGKVQYALEGSVFIAGAAIQWLRDGLKMIDESPDSEFFAMKVPDSQGVYVVPAFAGLGAPHWDMYARGAIFGLTRGVKKAHLVRATLESLAYQTADVLSAMQSDAGFSLAALRVDGGASANNLLMQFQADILNVPVERPAVWETTALGAAYLAGLNAGFYDQQTLASQWQYNARFEPTMGEAQRHKLKRGWQKAVERCKGWDDE